MKLRTILVASLTAASLSACGTGVKEIDLHDPNVPLDARKFVADAQDAVSIARARRDDAAMTLKFTQQWRSELLTPGNWPKGSENTVKVLQEFTTARVRMAELEYEKAEAQLDLAEAKYTLATAETAMRNDLAVYDLGPLRGETDLIRADIEKIAGEIEDQRIKLDKLSLEWWKAYASFTKGKETPAFYIDPELLGEVKTTQAEREKARAEAKKKDKGKDGEAKKGESTDTKKKEAEETISEEDKIDLDL